MKKCLNKITLIGVFLILTSSIFASSYIMIDYAVENFSPITKYIGYSQSMSDSMRYAIGTEYGTSYGAQASNGK